MTTVANTLPAGISVAQPTGATGTGKTTAEMGQTDFLKLLTAQLQTQDPFDPVDNSQLVSQMATISTSSGIAEMNSSLKEIKESLGTSASRLSDAASWIGRSMLVESNIAAPDRLGQYGGEVTIAKDVDAMSVDLVDGNGAIVKTIDLGAQKAGTVPFYWDGTDEAGNQIGTQALQVRVNAAAEAKTATWASIVGVQSPSDASTSSLITAIGNFKPANAIRLG